MCPIQQWWLRRHPRKTAGAAEVQELGANIPAIACLLSKAHEFSRRAMKPLFALWLLACALLLVGCASTIQYSPWPDQTRRVEDPTKARIYMMRPKQWWGSDVVLRFETSSTNVVSGREMIGEVGPGGFLCWERSPGPYDVWRISPVSRKPERVQFDLVAGNVYYFRINVSAAGMYARPTLRILEEQEGQALLKRSKPPRNYAQTR